MRLVPLEEKNPKRHKGIRPNRVLPPLSLLVKLDCEFLRLKTLGITLLTEKQLNAIQANMKRLMKSIGVVRIPLLADHPISKKPLEIRMGKGKGAVHHHSVKVNPGNTLVEVKVQNPKLLPKAIEALQQLQKKLPVKTSIDIL